MTSFQRPSQSSSTGERFTALYLPSLQEDRLKEDERRFNVLHHETEIHIPIPVFNLENNDCFSFQVTDCLDMPIRMAGETEYSLPDNWAALAPVLRHLINLEHANNQNWQDYYTYLSVEYTPYLEAGSQQRHAGCHTDGFQGVRIAERTKTSRSYVAVTNGGTRYFPQPFVANLDASKFNVFEGFDLQVKKQKNGLPIFALAEEKQFYFFDAYTVHESGGAARDGSRLFVRLTWEMKLFDRADNTKNAMLNYEWAPEYYDVRSDLVAPSLADIEAARLVPLT